MADAWGGSWGGAWGESWLALAALDITDTDILQKPVNCVLHGDQIIRDRYRTAEVRPQSRRETTTVARSGVKALGGKPGFTVKTSTRGYD